MDSAIILRGELQLTAVDLVEGYSRPLLIRAGTLNH